MGVSQSQKLVSKNDLKAPTFRSHAAGAPSRKAELKILAQTWIRESHGLYDFDAKEVKQVTGHLTGSHSIVRNDCDIFFNQVYSPAESNINLPTHQALGDSDNIIARICVRANATEYWVYHKALIDAQAEHALERKPEEKLWRVVKSSASGGV